MAKHEYEVAAELLGHDPIVWLTDHPPTAHKWYRDLCQRARPIDGGPGRVIAATISRDGTILKSTAVAGPSDPGAA